MADNLDVTPGTGATVAADLIATVLHQRVKITLGADGINDGDVASGNPMPITGTVTVTGSTTVVGTVSVTGSTTVVGTVTVTGSTTVVGTVTITGSTSVINTVTVTGSTSVINTVTITGSTTAIGNIASGSSDSGNPVKIGGVGKTANPTAVTDGQRVNGLFDKLGKQVTVEAIRDLKGVQQTSITTTAATTVISSASSVFLDVYGVLVTNTSASNTSVTFKDATGGTTRFILEAPATSTTGFTLTPSAAIPQASATNNWTATAADAVSSLSITMLYINNI